MLAEQTARTCARFARSLGLTIEPDGAGWLGNPCPACGAGKIHIGAGVDPAETWRCATCNAYGRPFDLIALALRGRRWGELSRRDQGDLLRSFAARTQLGAPVGAA